MRWMHVLDKLKLQYEELPSVKSKHHTVRLRRIGSGSSSFIQRTIQRKDTSKHNVRSRSFLNGLKKRLSQIKLPRL